MSNCPHEWKPLFTDQNSPQSYQKNGYRGFRIVGRRCVLCGEKVINSVGILDQIWEMVCADETNYQPHEIVERIYELLKDRYES